MLNTETFNFGYIGNDTTFELDSFSRPRIRSQIEMIKNVVLFILFSKPGNYPSLPSIGMNLQSLLYSYYDEVNEDLIRDRIVSQCNALGVYFDRNIIAVRKTIYQGQPSLMIHIESTVYDRQIENYNEYMDEENDTAFLIGISFDEMRRMVYNVNERHGEGTWR